VVGRRSVDTVVHTLEKARIINMVGVLVALVALQAACAAAEFGPVLQHEGRELANNQFFITNKAFHKARLYVYNYTQWDPIFGHYMIGDELIGTYEHDFNLDQLWTLEPHPIHKGAFYIVNDQYPTIRIENKQNYYAAATDGVHNDNQLWTFLPFDNNTSYLIDSFVDRKARIAKFGPKNDDLRLWTGDLMWSLEVPLDQQLWKLERRFKVEIKEKTIFHFDNRQGSTAITRSITVLTGLKVTDASTIRNKETYKLSMSQSLSGALEGLTVSMTFSAEFTSELENSFSHSEEKNWSQSETIKFTIPAGKNYKLVQNEVKFIGKVPDDSATLRTNFKIFESDSAEFPTFFTA